MNEYPDLWNAVWERLNLTFHNLANRVREANPQLKWTSGHYANDSFIFRAYASFSRNGQEGGEDLVISIDCRLHNGQCTLSSDISRGDGYVLADGPGVTIPLNVGSEAMGAQVLTTITAIEGFLERSLDILRRELGFGKGLADC